MKKEKENTQVLDYLMPDTATIEAQILADVFHNPVVLTDIDSIVHPTLFSNPDYRRVWETCQKIFLDGGDIDLTSLTNNLGPKLVAEIFGQHGDNPGSLFSARARAAALRSGAAKRRAFQAANKLLNVALLPGTSEQDILAAKEAFDRELEGPAPMQTEKHISTIIKDLEQENKKAAEAIAQGKSLRVVSGSCGIDDVLNGGFAPGQLIVLAARPSVGKTALMLQFAKAAAEAGNPTQIYSLEMTDIELGSRLAYSVGAFRPRELARGIVKTSVFEKLSQTLGQIPLYVNDASRSMDDIISRMSQAVRKGRCKVAYIDYLGLMSDTYETGNAKLYQAIGKITGTLKAAAKRLQIPIVLLCQLNRDQAREGRPPELFDLRDSGAIEQDSDVVIMLQSNYKDAGGTIIPLVAWMRKNRAGKKDYGYTFTPNDTYSAFYEGDILVPEGKVPEQAPPPPTEIPANVNGLNDLPEEDSLPF